MFFCCTFEFISSLFLIIFDSNTNFTTFNVEVKGANPTLKVQAVFTSLLNPYPTEITQMESQLVKLEGSHFFYSPYPTVTQKSVYKLASATIESFSKLSPHSVRGSAVHFGPYKDVAAFEVSAANSAEQSTILIFTLFSAGVSSSYPLREQSSLRQVFYYAA